MDEWDSTSNAGALADPFKLKAPLSLSEGGPHGPGPMIQENVWVLTKNFTPSQAQLNLLNRGLTFIPTFKLDRNRKKQLLMDIQNYHRKIKLAVHFRNTGKQKPCPFTAASTWSPGLEKMPPEVISLIEKDRLFFNKYYKHYAEEPNITQEEVEAIKELKENKHIIIKPADKGSAVVIQSREQYMKEVYRQLNDKIYYRKLDEPIYLKTIPIIHDIIDKLYKDKFINNRQRQYLKGEVEPRARKFYTLPKIHKDPTKWSWPNETPAGRPIVSDCSSETYGTAQFVEHYLNPLSVRHPSYVKDTYHFIQIVKQMKVPLNCMFFTFDIESLYTNIDIKSGLLAVEKIFLKYPDKKRPDEAILQLLEINLRRNDFEFNEEFFLQIKGTAMGKRFAPSYANIFMADWEEGALIKCPKKPRMFLRYLDDVWGIWDGTWEEFQEFVRILNTHDPSIKLKYEVDWLKIDYLDTTVYKGPTFQESQILDIKVFFKKTDTHALLFKNSFHPKHTFQGLVKSQLIRFQRICTQQKDFREAVHTLFTALRKRGYSRSFLRKCLKTYLNRKERLTRRLIPLITTYSTDSKKINQQLKLNFKEHIGDTKLLEDSEVISAYKKNQNLKDILVRAKLESLQPKEKVPRWFCYRKFVQNKRDQTFFKIVQKSNWKTKNCIYMIFCQRCAMQYIGETKNSLALRMTQHKYNICNKKDRQIPVVEHFILHGWEALRAMVIQSNPAWTDKERKQKERQWIYNLNTKRPFGLNIKH